MLVILDTVECAVFLARCSDDAICLVLGALRNAGIEEGGLDLSFGPKTLNSVEDGVVSISRIELARWISLTSSESFMTRAASITDCSFELPHEAGLGGEAAGSHLRCLLGPLTH